jgi:hypothetical protein
LRGRFAGPAKAAGASGQIRRGETHPVFSAQRGAGPWHRENDIRKLIIRTTIRSDRTERRISRETWVRQLHDLPPQSNRDVRARHEHCRARHSPERSRRSLHWVSTRQDYDDTHHRRRRVAGPARGRAYYSLKTILNVNAFTYAAGFHEHYARR